MKLALVFAMSLICSIATADHGCVDAHAQGKGVAGRCKVDHGKQETTPVVLAVGDSICSAVAAGGDGWHLRLSLPVVNRCVGGSTAAAVLTRLRADLDEVQPNIVLIELGSAQMALCEWSPFAADLASVVQEVRDAGATPILLGVIPTCSAYMRPRIYCSDPTRADGIVADVAASAGATYVDLSDFAAGAACKPLYVDWIHPSPAGYDLMAPIIDEALP